MLRIVLLLLITLSISISVVNSQADGWKMTDRFFGFRFEMGGDQLDNSILEHVQEYADKQSCFGWIQKGKNLNYVGEVRCSKTRGIQFLEWLQQIKHVAFFESLVMLLLYNKVICINLLLFCFIGL